LEESILIRGARVHNLKNVSLAIPHNLLTVVTGVSGSGKSSLVFDTVYAEGQRRYVESLSAYARQFLERMEKPDVDEIAASRRPSPSGRRTPRAIRAPRSRRPPRFTTICGCCTRAPGEAIAPSAAIKCSATPWIRLRRRCWNSPKVRAGTRCFRCAWEAERTRCAIICSSFARRASTRLYQNGRVFEFSTPESLLDIDFSQPLFILVDRFVISPDLHQRIVDTTEICYREAGEVIFEEATPQNPPPVTLRFSEKFACKRCGIELVTPEPSLFSFNNPMGACPRCQGSETPSTTTWTW
jgi:excinuclease ABC subunit A